VRGQDDIEKGNYRNSKSAENRENGIICRKSLRGDSRGRMAMTIIGGAALGLKQEEDQAGTPRTSTGGKKL